MSLLDLTGQRFGHLLVESRARSREKSPHGAAWWNCVCDCGTRLARRGYVMRRAREDGQVISCGCVAPRPHALPPGIAERNQLLSRYRIKAAERGLEFSLSIDEFEQLTAQDCHYCGRPPFQIKRNGSSRSNGYTYTGIDRVDSGQGYRTGNVVPCCGRCNSAKSDHNLDEFLTWIVRVYDRMVARAS